jgi:tetratricopeptide (TPR) repeat protein
VLGAGVSWGAYSAIPKDPYAVRQFNNGMNLYRKGRFDNASEHFIRAVKADPKNEAAQFALGRAYQAMKLFGPAVEAFLAADRLQPSPNAEACMGYCFARQDDHLRAIAVENAAIEGGMRTAEILNNRGHSWLQRKDLENAEKDLLEAIQLNDKLQAPHFNLGLLELVRAYRDQDHNTACQRGIEHIQRALEIGPERADLYYTGAKLYSFAAEKDPSKTASAIDLLEKAIRMGLNPSELTSDAMGFKAVANHPRFGRMADSSPPSSPAEKADRLLDPLSN